MSGMTRTISGRRFFRLPGNTPVKRMAEERAERVRAKGYRARVLVEWYGLKRFWGVWSSNPWRED